MGILVGSLILVSPDDPNGPAVVRIDGLACGSSLLGVGFLADEVIVTNAHVVAGAETLTVTDFRGRKREATVVGFDPAADLAALRVDGGAVAGRPASFGDADSGSAGSVLDAPFTVRRRIRAHIGDIYHAETVIRPSLEIAAEVMAGDSGAPLVTADGDVVGVVYATSRGKESTAYAIRTPEVEAFLAGLPDQPPSSGECR